MLTIQYQVTFSTVLPVYQSYNSGISKFTKVVTRSKSHRALREEKREKIYKNKNVRKDMELEHWRVTTVRDEGDECAKYCKISKIGRLLQFSYRGNVVVTAMERITLLETDQNHDKRNTWTFKNHLHKRT